MKQFFQKYFVLVGSILFALLVAIDQWTKALAVLKLKNQQPFVIWDGVLELSYLENTGAAWGMLKNKQIFFYVLTAVFCVIVLYEVYRLYKKHMRYMPFVYTLVLMLSGAIGNFIDRIRLRYVVDFIYVRVIDFPVFNLADCYITVSVILMILLMFFYYSDKEFDEILPVFADKTNKEQ